MPGAFATDDQGGSASSHKQGIKHEDEILGITQAPGVSVLKLVGLKNDGQGLDTVAAEVDAEIRNLLGASHSIDLKPVWSNGRISYISSPTHASAETLNLRVTAKPCGGEPAHVVFYRETTFQPKNLS